MLWVVRQNSHPGEESNWLCWPDPGQGTKGGCSLQSWPLLQPTPGYGGLWRILATHSPHVYYIFPCIPSTRGWQRWRHPPRPPSGHLPAHPGTRTADQRWPCVPGAGCGTHDCRQETGKCLGRLKKGQGWGGESMPLWAPGSPQLPNGVGGDVFLRSGGAAWVGCSVGMDLVHGKAHRGCCVNIKCFSPLVWLVHPKWAVKIIVSWWPKPHFQPSEIRNGFLEKRTLELGFGGVVECGHRELSKESIPDRGSCRDKDKPRLSCLDSLYQSDSDIYQKWTYSCS